MINNNNNNRQYLHTRVVWSTSRSTNTQPITICMSKNNVEKTYEMLFGISRPRCRLVRLKVKASDYKQTPDASIQSRPVSYVECGSTRLLAPDGDESRSIRSSPPRSHLPRTTNVQVRHFFSAYFNYFFKYKIK